MNAPTHALARLQAEWDAAAAFAAHHDLPPPPDARPSLVRLFIGGLALWIAMLVVLALAVTFGPDLAALDLRRALGW